RAWRPPRAGDVPRRAVHNMLSRLGFSPACPAPGRIHPASTPVPPVPGVPPLRSAALERVQSDHGEGGRPMTAERTLSYSGSGPIDDPTFPAPYLVIALECERPLAPPVRLSLAEVDGAAVGRADERAWSRVTEDGRGVLRIGVADGWMSGRHAAL